MKGAWIAVCLLLMSGTAAAQTPTPVEGEVRNEYMCGLLKSWYGEEYAPDTEYCDVKTATGYVPVTRTSKKAHPKLQVTGAILMFVGIMQTLPYGDHYRIFGEDVCVTRYSIDEGTCAAPKEAYYVAAAMVGTGFALWKIGGRRVAITPMINRRVKGVAASVAW